MPNEPTTKQLIRGALVLLGKLAISLLCVWIYLVLALGWPIGGK